MSDDSSYMITEESTYTTPEYANALRMMDLQDPKTWPSFHELLQMEVEKAVAPIKAQLTKTDDKLKNTARKLFTREQELHTTQQQLAEVSAKQN